MYTKMNKRLYKNSDFQITKREVLASVSIIALLLLIGFFISSKISTAIMDQKEIYNKAIKIEDKDLFGYGIKTNAGNAFVTGTIKAIDTVSHSDIKGEYISIRRVKEVYTRHTRVVKSGKSTRVEVYYTWDKKGTEYFNNKEVSFLEHTFNSNQFKLDDYHLDTVKHSSTVRYKYYVVDGELYGTIFANLKDNNIGDSVDFYRNLDSNTAYEKATTNSNLWLIIFWIIWTGVIGGAVYGFYYLENDWLE